VLMAVDGVARTVDHPNVLVTLRESHPVGLARGLDPRAVVPREDSAGGVDDS